MNILSKSFVTSVLVAGLAAGTAGAATFDFQGIADGGSFTRTDLTPGTGFESDWNAVVGLGLGLVDGGISVLATASGNDGAGNLRSLKPYFDAGSAGLGVCGALSSGSCSPSNDDNVGAIGGTGNAGGTTFETLILTFSKAVKATAINLAGEGHRNFGGSVIINGTMFGAADFSGNGDFSSLLSGSLASLGSASIWNFQYVPVGVVASTDEFYIDSISVAAVPLPAAGLLLLGALGGLAVIRRRKT